MMICNCLLDVLIFPNSFEKTGACNLPVLLTLSILQKKMMIMYHVLTK